MDLSGMFERYNPGPAATALCILFDGATLVTVGMNGGTASVVVHTLDRYWKFVPRSRSRSNVPLDGERVVWET